ncbi:hypothetical protein [Arthrobacter humicola]
MKNRKENKVPECFFCGANEKLTKAHLFQQSFRDAVNVDSDEVSLAASSVEELGVYRDLLYSGDIRQANATSLCSGCNNGWMNDIEQAAGPVFTSIMNGDGFPPPAGLFKLAHWSVVVGALASELIPRLDIPVEHRRAIRFTRTGQPTEFSTHFVWTLDYLPSFEIDIVRFAGESDLEEPIRWCFVLHVGWLVIIVASPRFGAKVSRVLHGGGIHSVMGTISSNIVYLPQEARGASSGVLTPSHETVRELHSKLFASAKYLETKGRPVLDLNSAIGRTINDLAFDYGDTLIDMRDKLDLSYLTRAMS